MENNFLEFNISLGKTKPENIINREADCPFCDRSNLKNIIDSYGDILLIENKYNVLEDTYQTVLIESSTCDIDIPDYSKEHMQNVLRFGIRHWFRMMDSGKYQSVLFFKNHGPLSGGSLRHPHMQIIGLNNLDSHFMYDLEEFQGIGIHSANGVELNIATNPRVGFHEFNIITNNNGEIDTLAHYIQITVDYLMNHFTHYCKSYNLFFYLVNGLIRVKIMPRFATAPLFIGYNIRLRPSNLISVAEKIHQLYFRLG